MQKSPTSAPDLSSLAADLVFVAADRCLCSADLASLLVSTARFGSASVQLRHLRLHRRSPSSSYAITSYKLPSSSLGSTVLMPPSSSPAILEPIRDNHLHFAASVNPHQLRRRCLVPGLGGSSSTSALRSRRPLPPRRPY
ncbi:hypothetical protein GQ55_1G270600 [Panicum hallii var. hallii]|uniref:Uncharacterized protein n=1 Tax=Panicum hallii var. hallii TaxID=1504633 RepID=A0A2T7F814_9POAL|nr:hypothetical protein GQ55_1G270600 [Panicum hallii var. hallii]